MASHVCETLAFIDGNDEVRQMEVLEINGDLLMSLMEESPSDESDDDRLDSLIKSFEAEISGSKMENRDSAATGSELASRKGEDMYTESGNVGAQMDGQDYWDSSCEFRLECVAMFLMPSSPWMMGAGGLILMDTAPFGMTVLSDMRLRHRLFVIAPCTFTL